MSGTILRTTVGYLLEHPEVTQVRRSKGLKYFRFYGLALGCCVGQILGPVLSIRDGPLLG